MGKTDTRTPLVRALSYASVNAHFPVPARGFLWHVPDGSVPPKHPPGSQQMPRRVGRQAGPKKPMWGVTKS